MQVPAPFEYERATSVEGALKAQNVDVTPGTVVLLRTGTARYWGENGGDADCTIRASEETLVKIARGEANPTTAYMTGKLKIKGDIGAAMKLQKLF